MNFELAKIFNEMAVFLDIKEVEFKPRAYERAAYSLENLDRNVKDIYQEGGLKALLEIPGVRERIAEKIEEYIKTGKIKEYQKFKKEWPVNIEELNRIEGIGPKNTKKDFEKFGIS